MRIKTLPFTVENTTYILYDSSMGMTAKDVMSILKRNGWTQARIKGSHHIFVKEGVDRSVVVPQHGNRDLGSFAYVILKQAGIEEKEVG